MSSIKRLTSLRLVAINYVGGMGYYAFHIGWLLIVVLLALQASQYIVFDGQVIPATPATSRPADDIVASTPALLLYATQALALAIAAASLLFVVGLPYLIGYASRTLPRWLIMQTNRQISTSSLHRTKQYATLLVACVSLVALYRPDAEPAANIAFFTIIGLCCGASICFWLQYKTAAHWKIPVSKLF